MPKGSQVVLAMLAGRGVPSALLSDPYTILKELGHGMTATAAALVACAKE